MDIIVNITDFRNNIGTYIDKVFYKKESFLLKKGKTVVARVTAYDDDRPKISAKEGLGDLAGLWEDLNMKKYKKTMRMIEKKDKDDMEKLVSFSNT
ncbi:hypothetical protein A2153_05025 [Candidatus Gottesmanbacteria bacterium RBG_16_38_7b]|uniref:Antitoxin n=2 Tax=Candidatus Gottesmaniibacteriota TaxID=1752720 RepID=A0A1F5YH65_9BACT|nr:MAG: hypothetical protein A2153_05025 [Candidatus Gottesmanbacteria bacterium RBG_16_38_7b]OGG32683.1 MAG: hypothetical protein A3I51_06240 [Candidatus Gottesmanbacteria bacterium RIFCSPLOWO2_02_FULL_38_8]